MRAFTSVKQHDTFTTMKKPVAQPKPAAYPRLITGIGTLLEESRRSVARAANCFMTATYWEIGRRIVEFEQGGKRRAEYGDELLERLSHDLTERHGRGFGAVNLSHMKRFYLSWPTEKIFQTLSEESRPGSGFEIFQTVSEKSGTPQILPTVSDESDEEQIWQTLSAKSRVPISATLSRISTADTLPLLRALAARFPLPWSHYVKLLTVKDENARRFYEDEALRGGWSVRQLDRQIGSLFYERTLLSKDKVAMLRKGAKPQSGDALTVDEAVRDPLVLEFLNLKDEYSETDLEDALVHHLEAFLLELGGDFTFVGRQRRLRVGGTWYRAWTSSSSIAACAVSSSSTSSLARWITPMPVKCTSTSATPANTGPTKAKIRPSASSSAPPPMPPSLTTPSTRFRTKSWPANTNSHSPP